MKRKLRKKVPATSASTLKISLSPSAGIKKGSSPTQTLHRGRKKRLQARQQLEKKKNFIQEEVEKVEKFKKQKEEKLCEKNEKTKNVLLSALKLAEQMQDALPEETDVKKISKEDEIGQQSKVSHKQRRKIIQNETVQVNNVRKHPSFKENPMEALRKHLLNTVSNDPTDIPPPLKTKSEKTKKNNKQSKKQNQTQPQKPAQGLTVQKETLQQINQQTREAVAKKREEKAAYAQIALKMKKEQNKNKIQKQTLTGLLGRRSSKGRIGEKRPKIM